MSLDTEAGRAAHLETRPYYRLLGVEILEAVDGRALVQLLARPELTNNRGEVHGGAIATALDAALSNAARSSLPEGHGVATLTMTVNYISAGRGLLTARGQVARVGRSVVAAEARIEDESGALVAQALGTLRALPPRG